jgi:hypothetical protein
MRKGKDPDPGGPKHADSADRGKGGVVIFDVLACGGKQPQHK